MFHRDIKLMIVSLVYLPMILIDGSKFGESGNNLPLNAALVVSSSNFEEPLISPTLVPTVGNQPIWRSWLRSPPHNLDSVSSESRAWGVSVDSGFVGEEVVVDGECGFHGTMGHDFCLDFGHLGRHAVDWVSIEFVLSVGFRVSTHAGSSAGGSRFAGPAWPVLSSVDVVVAGGEGIGIAPVVGVVEPSGNHSHAFPVTEGAWGVASVAAATAWPAAAGKDVFGWDSSLQGLSASNANTVGHCLSSSKSPARPTSTLIPNLLNWLTPGPILSGAELLRNVLEWLNIL